MVLFFTSYFILMTLENTVTVNFFYIFFLTVFFVAIDFILNFLDVFHTIFFDFVGLISCLCWLLNSIFLLLDIFFFFTAHIDVNPALISVILISVGN